MDNCVRALLSTIILLGANLHPQEEIDHCRDHQGGADGRPQMLLYQTNERQTKDIESTSLARTGLLCRRVRLRKASIYATGCMRLPLSRPIRAETRKM